MSKNQIILFFLFINIIGLFLIYNKSHAKELHAKELHNTENLTDTIIRKYTDWEILIFALIWQESKGNPEAKNDNSLGVLQITPIYVKEANNIVGYVKYNLENRKSVEKSIEMFNIVQGKHNKEKSIDRAIKLHNPTAGDWYYKSVKNYFNLLKYINSI